MQYIRLQTNVLIEAEKPGSIRVWASLAQDWIRESPKLQFLWDVDSLQWSVSIEIYQKKETEENWQQDQSGANEYPVWTMPSKKIDKNLPPIVFCWKKRLATNTWFLDMSSSSSQKNFLTLSGAARLFHFSGMGLDFSPKCCLTSSSLLSCVNRRLFCGGTEPSPKTPKLRNS